MRGQGSLFRPKNGRGEYSAVWWYKFGHRGKTYQGSTNTKNKKEAFEVLRKKIGEVKGGLIVGSPDKVTLKQLKALVETQYDLDGLRTKSRVVQYWKHLENFFGLETRAMDVTATRLDEYAVKRLGEGAQPQTKNNELSALRRGYTLAIEKGLLATMPTFNLPKILNARTGFFEEGDFAALLLELPPDVRDLVQFLRATGWRRDEARLLEWRMVDMEAGTIRLEEARSKSGEPRTFPFSLAPALKALLEKRWAIRDGLFVFHSNGMALSKWTIRSAWDRATKRAGMEGRLVHDLRRSAARDFRRAGIDEGTIMKLCGWKTRAMFDRYNVIDEADLARAVAKRFNGQTTARQENPAEPQ
jgi:integrase